MPLQGFFLGMLLGAVTGVPWLLVSEPWSRPLPPQVAITNQLP